MRYEFAQTPESMHLHKKLEPEFVINVYLSDALT